MRCGGTETSLSRDGGITRHRQSEASAPGVSTSPLRLSRTVVAEENRDTTGISPDSSRMRPHERR